MLSPDEFPTEPPAALVPVLPAEIEHSSVQGWHICATWSQGLEAGTIGHLYAIHVLAAAVVSGDVWDALAEATLAGLCIRCSPPREHERLLYHYVKPIVVAFASQFTWAHGPVLGLACGGCTLKSGLEDRK